MSFTDKERMTELEDAARDFWDEVESEAAKLEVTVDYYIAEFI